MIKNILATLVVLVVAGTQAMAYNYYSMSNPASPVSPLNPANPASPLHPIHSSNRYRSVNREDYTYDVYRVYELCYNGKCKITRSHELGATIRQCLKHGGGYACLDKIID